MLAFDVRDCFYRTILSLFLYKKRNLYLLCSLVSEMNSEKNYSTHRGFSFAFWKKKKIHRKDISVNNNCVITLYS